MKDKEKQIEEMAKEMHKRCYECQCGCDLCEQDNNESPHCQYKCKAKHLIEQGYRKLPEGSVVLSKEEYEAMKTDRQNLVNKYNQADEAVDYWCERFKNASKEKAEKLLNEIYWLVARKDTINVLTRIQEIATREGVEIKE